MDGAVIFKSDLKSERDLLINEVELNDLFINKLLTSSEISLVLKNARNSVSLLTAIPPTFLLLIVKYLPLPP